MERAGGRDALSLAARRAFPGACARVRAGAQAQKRARAAAAVKGAAAPAEDLRRIVEVGPPAAVGSTFACRASKKSTGSIFVEERIIHALIIWTRIHV
jgi:hypothetical protein